jgi:hypothetical protein
MMTPLNITQTKNPAITAGPFQGKEPKRRERNSYPAIICIYETIKWQICQLNGRGDGTFERLQVGTFGWGVAWARVFPGSGGVNRVGVVAAAFSIWSPGVSPGGSMGSLKA